MRRYVDVSITLVEKDFKIRYRNSVLGFLWSLLNPLAYMIILTLVFSYLLRFTIPNFAAWILIALLLWRFFSLGTSQGLFSILANSSLVNRVYVSRYLIVFSNNTANFLGSCLEFLVLLPLLVVLGVRLSLLVLFVPVVLLLEFLLVFGISLSLASLMVRHRDFYQLWDIALQLGFFLSPIIYDASLIPLRYRLVYSLNPVTILIESTRAIFLLQQLPSLTDMAVLVSSITFLLVLGGLVFHSFEPRFAEDI